MSIVNGISLLGQQFSRLEFCVRQANNKLLQTITTKLSEKKRLWRKWHNTGLAHALQLTMKYQLVSLQHTLVQYMQLHCKYNILTKEIRNDCPLSVVMYNNHMLLEQMLICLNLNVSNDYIFISKCCMILQKRENCSKLLQQHRII